MGGHDGQPISKLIGHLLHLLGHATEPKSLYNWEYKWAVLGSHKQGQLVLTTGTRGHLA